MAARYGLTCMGRPGTTYWRGKVEFGIEGFEPEPDRLRMILSSVAYSTHP